VFLVLIHLIQLRSPHDNSGTIATVYYFNFSSSWTLLNYASDLSVFRESQSTVLSLWLRKYTGCVETHISILCSVDTKSNQINISFLFFHFSEIQHIHLLLGSKSVSKMTVFWSSDVIFRFLDPLFLSFFYCCWCLFPDVVSEFFIDIISYRSHYGPGVESASNRNEYQEHFLRCRCVRLTTYHHSVPLSRNLGTLTFLNPLGSSGPVTGLIYLYLYLYLDVYLLLI